MIMESITQRSILGKIFFLLSIIILGVMIFSPFDNIILQIDEFFTIGLLNFPISDIITITGNDVHPPLYYLICKFVLKVLNVLNLNYNLIQVLRLISIIPYFLVLVISYTKFKEEYGWFTVGLFPFVLVLMSEFFFYFLTIRMYSWGLLFILLVFIYFKEFIKNFDKKSLCLLTVFSVLGAYTHYFVAISILFIYISLFIYLFYNNKDEIKNFFVAVVAAIILYSPWLVVLFGQLKNVHDSYWIPEIDFNLVINCFAYYGPYIQDIAFQYLLIIILIFFIMIFIYQSNDYIQIDKWLIVSGFTVFIGTIVLGVVLSLVFKPILIARYLMPSASILWLVVVILISKLKNDKLFFISLILIILLCISGVSSIFSTTEGVISHFNEYDKVLDEINSDNGSVVIFSNAVSMNHFRYFLNDSDLNIGKFNEYLGIDSDRYHQAYKFNELSKKEIDDVLDNHPEHNIYLIEAYGKLDISDQYRENPILTDGKINFYKVN